MTSYRIVISRQKDLEASMLYVQDEVRRNDIKYEYQNNKRESVLRNLFCALRMN